MKILFLTRLFYPHTGGVERHIEFVSKELIKKGHEITIIAGKHDRSLPDEEIIEGVRVKRVSYPDIKFLGLLVIWFKLVKNIKLFLKADIIHIHDVFIWYLPLRILLPLKKVYMTFHGQWGKYPLSINEVLQKRAAALFSTANLSIGKYIPHNYGYQANLISYGATSLIYINEVEKDLNLVIYVGRLDAELPVRKMFKVFGKMKNHKVIICGDGELKNEASKYGEVKGFVNPDTYYKKAGYVFASGYLTIIEALASRCLVFVIYDNPLHKDYYSLTPFRKYIIIARSSNELLKKFNYYTSHPKKAQKKIDLGYKWAKNQTWEKMMKKYLKLWKLK